MGKRLHLQELVDIISPWWQIFKVCYWLVLLEGKFAYSDPPPLFLDCLKVTLNISSWRGEVELHIEDVPEILS